MIDRLTLVWGQRRILQLGGAFIALGLFMSALFPYFIITIISFMIIGIGTAGIVPTIYSIAGQKTTISTSIALTIVSSISFIGFLIGPPIIGYISSVTSLKYSFLLIGFMGISIFFMSHSIKVLRSN